MASEPLDPLTPPPGGADTPAGMGLLPYLNVHALDDDYEHVAAQRASGSGSAGGWDRSRILGAVVAGMFAVLVVTAATQTSRNAVSDEHQREELIKQINQRKAQLDRDQRRLAALRAETDALRTQLLDNDRLSSGTRARLTTLSTRTGTLAVSGPGVSVLVDDAPHAESDRNRVLDSDLQALVNGLWRAGAEAISINGNRLTNLTAIRQAGSAITVNYRSLSRPYRVLAIGDPKTLPARFADSTSGQSWLDLQQQVGLRFSIKTSSSLQLPAAPVPILRFVQGKKGSSS